MKLQIKRIYLCWPFRYRVERWDGRIGWHTINYTMTLLGAKYIAHRAQKEEKIVKVYQ